MDTFATKHVLPPALQGVGVAAGAKAYTRMPRQAGGLPRAVLTDTVGAAASGEVPRGGEGPPKVLRRLVSEPAPLAPEAFGSCACRLPVSKFAAVFRKYWAASSSTAAASLQDPAATVRSTPFRRSGGHARRKADDTSSSEATEGGLGFVHEDVPLVDPLEIAGRLLVG